MSWEPFLYLTVFLVVALFALATRWLKQQIGEHPMAEDEPGRPSPDRATPQVSRPRIREVPQAHEPPRRLAAPPPTPGEERRHRGHPRIVSLREVRRGIILMTILGPCRALERPGVSDDRQ